MSNSSSSNVPHIALLHPDERQRTMLASALSRISLSLTSGAQWSDIVNYPLRLGGVWLIFDEGQATEEAILHIRKAPEQAFWGILIIGQGNTNTQQKLRTLGIDAYLPYPFDFNLLSQQLRSIEDKRAPISNYQVLPAQVAGGLDRVWARFDSLNYYQLLELDIDSSDSEIQARFHQRSLVLHPDRHRRVKQSHPPVYDRVNLIYKRVLEAYRILSDPLQRPLYDAALSLGSTRWNYKLEEQKRLILESSEQQETQLALAKALSWRNRGLLKPAYELMLSICQREPNNSDLKANTQGYQKLLELACREPEIAMVIQQQVAP